MPTDSIHVFAGIRFVTEPFEPAYMRRALIAMLLLGGYVAFWDFLLVVIVGALTQ